MKKGTNSLVFVLIFCVVAFIGYQAFMMFGFKNVATTVVVAAQDTMPEMPVTTRRLSFSQRVPFWYADPIPPEMVDAQGCATKYLYAGDIIARSSIKACEGFAAVSIPLQPEYNSPVLPQGVVGLFCFVPHGPGTRDFCSDNCIPDLEEYRQYPLNVWNLSLATVATQYDLPHGTTCVTGYVGVPLNDKGQAVARCDNRGDGGGTTVVAPDAMPAMQTSGAAISTQKDDCQQEEVVSRILVLPPNAIATLGRYEFFRASVTTFMAVGDVPMWNETIVFLSDEESNTGRGEWYILGDKPAWGPDSVSESTPLLGATPEPTPTPIAIPTPIIEPTPVVTSTQPVTDTVVVTPTVEFTLPITTNLSITSTSQVTGTIVADRLTLRRSPNGEPMGSLLRDLVVKLIAWDGDTWVMIETPDAVRGWASREYIESEYDFSR